MMATHARVRTGTAAIAAAGAVLTLLVAAALGAQSAVVSIGLFGALAAGAFALATQQVQKPLLAAVFFLAPVDISKAVIAPLVSRYTAAGPFYSPGLYISLAHLALLALFAVWMGRRIVLERRWPPLTGLDALALAFLAWIWSRSLGSPQGALALGSAASYSLAVLGFYVCSHAIADARDLRLVIKASLAVFALMLAHVALQALTQQPLPLPGAKALASGATVDFGGESSAFRPSGFFNHPNALAHYLVVLLPPALALALLGRRRLPARVWWIALAVTAAAGAELLLTLSRGGWASAALAAVVVLLVYARCGLVSRRQLAWMALAVVVAAVVVVIVYPAILLRLTAPDNRSLESRVLLADLAFTIIQANPLAGVGFGGFNRAGFEYSAPLYATVSADYQAGLRQLVVHNHFLLLAAELGIPAMLGFVYLLWRFVRLGFPLRQWRDFGAFAIGIGLAAAVVGEALFFNSDNYYADIRIFIFWLAAGVLQAISLQAREAVDT